MHAQAATVLLLAAAVAPLVSANAHNMPSRRRHHARKPAPPSSREVERDVCTLGEWRCTGTLLQRCYNEAWNTVQDCQGENIVCAASEEVTGCVWTWNVPSSSMAASAVSTPSLGSIPAPSASASADGDDDEWDCEDDDTTSSSAMGMSSTSAVSSAPTSSPTGSAGSVDPDEGGEEWCDDDEPATSSTASESYIGGNLWAGHGWKTASSSSSASYDDGQWHPSPTASYDGGQWEPTASATQISATASGSASYDDGMYHPSATASYDDGQWNASSGAWNTQPVTSSRKHHHGSATSSAAAANATTSALPTNNSTSPATNTTTPTTGPASSRRVVYADNWLDSMPTVAQLGDINVFILAFWMSTTGPVDNAQNWQWMDPTYRQQTLDAYHAAGITLMVSAFGSTDTPTSNGADPQQTAQDLAQYVQAYGFDGVDIDYEDMDAMNGGSAEAWLIAFQTELRQQLPAPYLISHAPVAPWFTSAEIYNNGAYVGIHKEVGDGIDFYNIQFYNQGNGVYCECETLLHQSGGYWPSTSVFEINTYAGVPLEKILIGKPLDEGAADNGFMDASVLGKCVAQAAQLGWNGGFMFWEFDSSAPSIVQTVMNQIA